MGLSVVGALVFSVRGCLRLVPYMKALVAITGGSKGMLVFFGLISEI